jgi:anti-sigma factor RsiW
MKKTCNPETIVSYLYDDLSADDRRAFEQHLDSCEPCHSEVQSLKGLRGTFTPEPVPPMPRSIQLPTPTPQLASVLPLHQSTWFRVVATVAAAVILVVLTARLVDLHVQIADGAMIVRFGDVPGSVAKPEPVETAPNLEFMFAEFKVEQQHFVNSLSDSVRMSQQRQLDQTLAAFERYLDRRRSEDLELIALSLDEMQQLNDNRFIETQYVISQLINQMNQDLITFNRR